MKLQRLTENIWYLPSDKSKDRPVLGYIDGKHPIIIDAGNSEAHAEMFINELKSNNLKHPEKVIITHWHWDHVFGIHRINAKTITTTETAEKLKYLSELKWSNNDIDNRVKTGEEIEFCREYILKELPDNNRVINIKHADNTFDKVYKGDTNNIKYQVECIDCDHSEDSCIIIAEDEGVLFLGDSLYMNLHTKEWTYTVEKLIPYLKKLLSYNAEHYIASHQPPLLRRDIECMLATAEQVYELIKKHGYNKQLISNNINHDHKNYSTDFASDIIDGFINNHNLVVND
ncbi:MAG: MBL fold metallo-hydrolase [Bacteroidales bacterium]|jgi:glyoxylase-like metal-dependent hydrolase (beta-lactamase superfamily II)|nr:MBL fold metallo-hydrolase [Bacteroidales bacterium]